MDLGFVYQREEHRGRSSEKLKSKIFAVTSVFLCASVVEIGGYLRDLRDLYHFLKSPPCDSGRVRWPSQSWSGLMGATWIGRWFIALDIVIAVRQNDGEVASVAKGDIGIAAGE